MIKNILIGFLILAILLFLFLVVVNAKELIAYITRPKEGSTCVYASEPAYIEGIIKDGKCIIKPNTGPGPGLDNQPAPASDKLEVINPSGAYVYYQQPLQSGGLIYSKSNVVIPLGAKLTFVKEWWDTSTANKKIYETTYQIAGRNAFFREEDLKKI